MFSVNGDKLLADNGRIEGENVGVYGAREATGLAVVLFCCSALILLSAVPVTHHRACRESFFIFFLISFFRQFE